MMTMGFAELVLILSALAGPGLVPEPLGSLGLAAARGAVPILWLHAQGRGREAALSPPPPPPSPPPPPPARPAPPPSRRPSAP